MSPDQYDAWYYTERGRWIGEIEFHLILELLEPEPGARLLDVGCGTGYFTRRLAAEGYEVTGLDPDPEMLAFARAHSARENYVVGDARKLPFADGEFDYCVSIAALCFIADEGTALREMARVCPHGVALGLLNRRSLLYLQKGRGGGRGAYRGARWHTPSQARELLEPLPMSVYRVRTAICLPSGGAFARGIETALSALPFGAFIAACAREAGASREG